MCLDTATKLDPQQEGVGYKCFRTYKDNLYTMLQHTPVERGVWITNPRPNDEIGLYAPTYRSGFHVLTQVKEAYLYLAHEWGFENYPWRISSAQYEILPVKYKNGHTSGEQYGYKVIVADDIYILTPDELRHFESNRS